MPPLKSTGTVDTSETPGANTSTQSPMLEKRATEWSAGLSAPTEICLAPVFGSAAGIRRPIGRLVSCGAHDHHVVVVPQLLQQIVISEIASGRLVSRDRS